MELYKDTKKQNINEEIKKLNDEILSEIVHLYNDIINIVIPKIIIDLDKKYIKIYNQNNKKYSNNTLDKIIN